ncbi:hypothetical protein [Nostoc sp. FACHB-892]|jgi:hypothetical protein|nr:hypothetical protein [Nostoc sp. FACHB-892]
MAYSLFSVAIAAEKSLSFWGASFTRPFFEEFFIEELNHSQKINLK